MKEPKAGSRKADVFKAMKSGGYASGLAKAMELGLQETTVRSWAPAWGVTVPPRSNAGGTPEAPRPEKAPKAPAERAPDAPPKAPQDWVPFFKYTSRGLAQRAIDGVCKRSGCAPWAYRVIEDRGLFGYAPAHYKPTNAAPVFKVGDYVVDAITPGVVSRVTVTGQLTCTIVADDVERVMSSYYLQKTDAPKAKAKPKAKAPAKKGKAKTGAKKK